MMQARHPVNFPVAPQLRHMKSMPNLNTIHETNHEIKQSVSPSPPTTSTPGSIATSTTSMASHGSITPTPTPSHFSRRPNRKSTLTQQQKNQKRQRATQDQLSLLEVEFSKNPTPTAIVRDRIAQEINMTERSVQIWFQNRRAKIKNISKKSLEHGDEYDALVPESYRQYLAMQELERGQPMHRKLFGANLFGIGGMFPGNEFQNGQKMAIQHFSCRSLTIGTWRRIGQNAMDLVIFYSLGDKQPSITYYINNESAGYKIEVPFSTIKTISLEQGGPAEDGSMHPPGLVLEVSQPPNFFMDQANHGGFKCCGDFTEGQQASQVFTHFLGGDLRALNGQLAKLTMLDSFQNRHNPGYMPEMHQAAPVMNYTPQPATPPAFRPVSQPNTMGPPPVPVHQSMHMGIPLMPRGHKRQRSRSVPDLSSVFHQHQSSMSSMPVKRMMPMQMPSLHVQQPSTSNIDTSIFANVPQQSSNLMTTPAANLRINTSPAFGIDYSHFAPSPTGSGAVTPSEYAHSPGLFGGQLELPTHTGYTFSANPYLSPLLEHSILQPSPTPLSALDESLLEHADSTASGEDFLDEIEGEDQDTTTVETTDPHDLDATDLNIQIPTMPPLQRSASVDFLNLNQTDNTYEQALAINFTDDTFFQPSPTDDMMFMKPMSAGSGSMNTLSLPIRSGHERTFSSALRDFSSQHLSAAMLHDGVGVNMGSTHVPTGLDLASDFPPSMSNLDIGLGLSENPEEEDLAGLMPFGAMSMAHLGGDDIHF